MRALKTLVIGMAVLIVAGIVVMVVVAVERAGNGGNGGDAGRAGAGARTTAFAPNTLDLPAGAEIVETRVGDGRIVLRLKLADGGARLMVIDAATGRLTGIVDLKRQ